MLLLDAVVLRCLAWQFNFDFRVTLLIVLWALGWAMITLALLVRWPPTVAAVFGIVLDRRAQPARRRLAGIVRRTPAALAHPASARPAVRRRTIMSSSSRTRSIPWIGVTAVGYALGQCFDWDAARRRTFLLRTGLSLVLAFVALRALNVYGDPVRWSTQAVGRPNAALVPQHDEVSAVAAVLLMTLGPALLFLRAVDVRTPEMAATSDRVWTRPALLLCDARHRDPSARRRGAGVPIRRGALGLRVVSARPISVLDAAGVASFAPYVYGIWIGVVVGLWPLCRWFARVKATRRSWWLSYL